MKFLLLLSLLSILVIASKAMGLYYKEEVRDCVDENNVTVRADASVFLTDTCGYKICENGNFSYYDCGDDSPPEGYKEGVYLHPEAEWPDCCEILYEPIGI